MANPPKDDQFQDVTTTGYAPSTSTRPGGGTYEYYGLPNQNDKLTQWIQDKKAAKKASKAAESDYRANADYNQQEALNSARNMQGQVPFLRDQINQVNSLWNRGSQEANAQFDSQGLTAQRASLGQLQDMARQGFNAQDEATVQSANRQANMNEQAQRQAVQQQAAMSGQRGGGLQMMGAMMAQQAAANRNADQASQMAQARIAARQNAVGQANQAATTLAQQGYNQTQNRGAAIDAFNQAMLGNQQNLTQQNFANKLAASQNYSQAAQNSAQYDQTAADGTRQRRNSTMNAILGMFGSSMQ